MSGAIHQEVVFSASPERVYKALMTAAEHSAFTGAPAQISQDAGGVFSCYDGQVVGRNIDIVENKRIVQAWRVAAWDEGVYSIVRIELQKQGDETKLVLDHLGFDAAQQEHLDGGWHARYWEKLAKYLT